MYILSRVWVTVDGGLIIILVERLQNINRNKVNAHTVLHNLHFTAAHTKVYSVSCGDYVDTTIFIEPLLSNGCSKPLYLAFAAEQGLYMPQYNTRLSMMSAAILRIQYYIAYMLKHWCSGFHLRCIKHEFRLRSVYSLPRTVVYKFI
jgi:hypothetical protein